jgi:signal transduction histidine kinase
MHGNPIKYGQIVTNIVSNAIDAYRDTELRPDQREVIVILRRDGEYIELSIRDFGSGIPSEHLEHIFEPFYTTKAAHDGMGIGLATVDAIVKKDFAGSVRVDSREGKGSEFIVSLPLRVTRTDRPSYDITEPPEEADTRGNA